MDTKASKNVELIRRLIAEVDKHNFAIADEIISSSCVWHMPGGVEAHGVEDFRASSAAFQAGFPDLKHNIKLIFGKDDLVALRMVNGGTHTGTFHEIKPTGKKVSFGVNTFYRMSENKVVEGWIEFDQLALMTAIGAVGPVSAE